MGHDLSDLSHGAAGACPAGIGGGARTAPHVAWGHPGWRTRGTAEGGRKLRASCAREGGEAVQASVRGLCVLHLRGV